MKYQDETLPLGYQYTVQKNVGQEDKIRLFQGWVPVGDWGT
jgi:hypothetical protein